MDALRSSLIDLPDDGKFDDLQAASVDLAGAFATDRKLLLRAVHAVQDASTDSDDPVLERAAEVVEERWVTFRGKTPQGAVTLLRLTTITAIELAIAADDELSALVWYEGSASMARYESHGLTGTWKAIIERAGDRTAETARRAWELAGASVEIDSISNAKKIEAAAPSHPSDSWLQTEIHAALDNVDAAGVAIPGGNPHQPAQIRAWAKHAAQHLSAVFDKYSTTLQSRNGKANAEMAESIQAALNSLATSVRSATRNALKGVIEAQEHLDRRSRLLWWSRTMHSTSLDVSYRSLPSDVLPFVVALDVRGLVGTFAPMSVESLIREVIRATGCESKSVSDLSDALADAVGSLSEVAAPYAVDLDGRVPLVRHLAARASGAPPSTWSDASADSRDGDAGTLAVWVYRSAQAHSLAYDVR